MIGVLKVSAPEMITAANELSAYIAQMSASFESMRAIMQQSENYWVGEAGNAHRALYEEKVDKIQEILSRYREHVTDLNAMAGVYEEAETQAQAAADELPTIDL